MRKTGKKDENYNLSKLHKIFGAAAAGLCYISEIDSEVYPFTQEYLRPESLKSLHKLLKTKTLEARAFDQFRSRLSEVKEWQNEKGRANTLGFIKLFEVLNENLSEIRLVRIGEVEFDIYVVGFDKEGRLAGVFLHAMET